MQTVLVAPDVSRERLRERRGLGGGRTAGAPLAESGLEECNGKTTSMAIGDGAPTDSTSFAPVTTPSPATEGHTQTQDSRRGAMAGRSEALIVSAVQMIAATCTPGS
jgi:hypothetical protein